jgi:hypothetical protein
VIAGSGATGKRADFAIESGLIARVAHHVPSDAGRIIDAAGLGNGRLYRIPSWEAVQVSISPHLLETVAKPQASAAWRQEAALEVRHYPRALWFRSRRW